MTGRAIVFAVLAAACAASHGYAATVVTQVEYPWQLVVRGEQVRVSYELRRSEDRGTVVPRAVGTLFVRNDRQRHFVALRLHFERSQGRYYLRARVPDRFLVGRRLYYYGVIRTLDADRATTLPVGGARVAESVWVLRDAFRVRVGRQTFGRTAVPEAIVARAQATEVGFNSCPECHQPFGPWSFEIGRDRSVWLFDYLGLTPDLTAGQILSWTPGEPEPVARKLQLPFAQMSWERGSEFAVGPDQSIYVLRGGPPSPPAAPGQRLTRLSASGQVLWTSHLDRACCGFNTPLRTGPDGMLYFTNPTEGPREFSGWRGRWVPIATRDGRPLSRAAQKRGTRWSQPVPGGLRLVGNSATFDHNGEPHEARLALIDRAGRVVRAWRVTSSTIVYWDWNREPAFVGGDPVLTLTAVTNRSTPPEHVLLRLGRRGQIRASLVLPVDQAPLTPFGNYAITDIRVQPDGKVYQLGSAPDFGVAIYRYALVPPP